MPSSIRRHRAWHEPGQLVLEGFDGARLPLRNAAGGAVRKLKDTQPDGVLWIGPGMGFLLFQKGGSWVPGTAVLGDGRMVSLKRGSPDLELPATRPARDAAAGVIRDALRGLLAYGGTAARDPDAAALLHLPTTLHASLLGLAQSAADLFPRVAWLDRPARPTDPPLPERGAPPCPPLEAWQFEFAHRIDSFDWQRSFHATLRTGQLRLPGLPGSAGDARGFNVLLNAGKSKNAVTIAIDESGGNSYLVLAVNQFDTPKPVAVAFPEDGSMIILDPYLPDHMMNARFINAAVMAMLEAGEALPRWISAARHEVALFMSDWLTTHLGHFIWQECDMLRAAIEGSLGPPPVLYALEGGGGDLFGPVENIFPEYAGRVLRHLPDRRSAWLECVRQQRLPLPLFGEGFVCKETRDRLGRAVAADPATPMLRDAARAMGIGVGSDPPPVVALGLRLQDRSPEGIEEFYTALISRLCTRYGRCVIIIDGLNTKTAGIGQRLPMLYSAKGRTDAILAEELALADRLRNATAHLPVHLVSCVGVPVLANLFWLAQADYFISPYGGGLAKTRWALNLPGFVMASRLNLTRFEFLDMYNSERYMEAPSPLAFNAPEDTEDIFGEGENEDTWPPLFVPFMVNFRWRWDRAVDDIVQAIGQARADRRQPRLHDPGSLPHRRPAQPPGAPDAGRIGRPGDEDGADRHRETEPAVFSGVV